MLSETGKFDRDLQLYHITIVRTHDASVLLSRWLLTLEQQILLMELSNPSFSNKFFFNQWLPLISINIVFMHSWDENTVFHDAWLRCRFYSPHALRQKTLNNNDQWPEPGCWPVVFVKTMVCCGCWFLQAQKNWFCSLLFKHCLVTKFHCF